MKLPDLDISVTVPATSSDPRFTEIHNEIRRHALRQALDADAKHELARRLAEAVGQDFDSIVERRLFQLMTPSEVTSLDPALVSVQLHTHRHRTPRDEGLFRRELDDNRAAIMALRPEAAPLNHFCYPSGDYVQEYAEWLQDAGVNWATTCDPGLATKHSDPYFLPRFIDAAGVTDATFDAWVSGLSYFAFTRQKAISNRIAP